MTTTMMAEPVSPETARQAAARFLNKKGVSLKSEAMRAKNRAMGHSDSGEQTEASPYYVFNATASQGFVVVSGDDCVGGNLVLGYMSQGSFDAEAVPDNLQWWLDMTATQISTLSRLGVKARTVALHNDIAPMVTTRWDQGVPYNAFCPMTDGKQCITGCMATALSQVMYYYRWPQGPIAEELPAYTMANGRVIDGLPVTSFDWDNMVDDYTKNTTEAQQAAVATLMRYCGQVIQMDYGPQLSNGRLYDTDLLVNSFGYDPVVFPAQPNIYENFQLGSNMRKDLSIRLTEALEPGEYGVNLLIANDFHSRIPNDYFVFAAGPLTVTPPTSIRSIDDGQFTIDNEAGAWYDLNGRRLSGKPAAKGLYIVKGRKVVIK